MFKHLTLLLSTLVIGQHTTFAQNQNNCPKDIVFNNVWTGGSGQNNAPNMNDTSLGVYIEGNVTITESINCACLVVAENATLSVATGAALYVEDALELNGDIRLLGSAQLIQKHNDVSKVTGLGKLYKDQNSVLGTTYEYSFWSSPVKEIGKSFFRVGAVMKDGTIPLSDSSIHTNITFVTSLDGSTTPLTISSFWIFGMVNGLSPADWSHKRETGLFNPGEGYSMKGPGAPQNYTYIGTPNDGTLSINVIENTASILGNPYPSALDAHLFLNDNQSISDLHFFDQKEFNVSHGSSAYDPYRTFAVRNRITGVAAPTQVKGIGGINGVSYQGPGRYIPIGQGFYANVVENGTISFKNAHRAYYEEDDVNSIFINRSSTSNTNQVTSDFSVLKLGFEFKNQNDEEIHRQTAISFIEGNSMITEKGIDSKAPVSSPTDMYFKFPGSNDELVIAGIQEVTEGLEFPITLKIANRSESIKLMVDELHNISHSFVLIDKLHNRIYDILDSPISLLLTQGVYTDRFYIRFGERNQDVNLEDDLLIYSHKKEVIIKPFNNTTVKSYTIHNVLGQKLLSSSTITFAPNEVIVRVPTTRFATGVLFVSAETDKGTFKKKLILQ